MIIERTKEGLETYVTSKGLQVNQLNKRFAKRLLKCFTDDDTDKWWTYSKLLKTPTGYTGYVSDIAYMGMNDRFGTDVEVFIDNKSKKLELWDNGRIKQMTYFDTDSNGTPIYQYGRDIYYGLKEVNHEILGLTKEDESETLIGRILGKIDGTTYMIIRQEKPTKKEDPRYIFSLKDGIFTRVSEDLDTKDSLIDKIKELGLKL